MKASPYLRSAAALLTLLLLLTGCLGLRCDAACSLRGVPGQSAQGYASAADHCAGMAMARPHDGVHAGAVCSMAKSCVPGAVAPLPQLADLGPALLPRRFEALVFVLPVADGVAVRSGSTTARHLQIPPLLQAGSLRV